MLLALQETVMLKKAGEISFIDNYSMGQHYFHVAKAWKSLFMIPSTFSYPVAENLIILFIYLPIQHYCSLSFCLLR